MEVKSRAALWLAVFELKPNSFAMLGAAEAKPGVADAADAVRSKSVLALTDAATKSKAGVAAGVDADIGSAGGIGAACDGDPPGRKDAFSGIDGTAELNPSALPTVCGAGFSNTDGTDGTDGADVKPSASPTVGSLETNARSDEMDPAGAETKPCFSLAVDGPPETKLGFSADVAAATMAGGATGATDATGANSNSDFSAGVALVAFATDATGATGDGEADSNSASPLGDA